MASSPEKKYDFIIFGASGFTGQYVVEEAAKTVAEEGGFKWAVAGRNASKLQKVLTDAAGYLGENLDHIPLVMADVAVQSSIIEMCQQAKVILNCVGPYQLYGEPVVRACIETGTHHVDISGEPAFLERMQLLYHGKAQEAGVYILQSCGFDSIPADIGVVHMQQQFQGNDVNDVESYLLVQNGPQGGHGNIGTWQSAILGFSNAAERARMRKQLCAKPLPKSPHKMIKRLKVATAQCEGMVEVEAAVTAASTSTIPEHKTLNTAGALRVKTRIRSSIFNSSDVNSWVLPFFGADRSIVSRSQRYNYEVKGERPIQFNAFMRVSSIFHVVYLCMMGLMFGVCSKFSLGRWLMLKFPRLMSLGLFSSEGPTRKQIKTSSFNMTFIGRGHGSHLADTSEQHSDKPDKRIVTRVSGPEIGYDTTPICMMQATYVLLKEQDKMPKSGGVFTPGMAFADTTIIQRLDKCNLSIRVLEKTGF